LRRQQTLTQQLQPERTIARVRPRLRRHRTDARLRERHHRADREKFRFDRDAEIAVGRVECDEGEGRELHRISDFGFRISDNAIIYQNYRVARVDRLLTFAARREYNLGKTNLHWVKTKWQAVIVKKSSTFSSLNSSKSAV